MAIPTRLTLQRWRQPIAAWAVSRAVAFAGLAAAQMVRGSWGPTGGLLWADGGWFRSVAVNGYPASYSHGQATTWPFFPLFPWLADALAWTGLSIDVALVVVAWSAALVMLVGLHRLLAGRWGTAVGSRVLWLVALLPGMLGTVLAYSDSVFLAGMVWTLVGIDAIARPDADAAPTRPRFGGLDPWWRVGLAAAVATAARPNGALLLVAVLVAVWALDRRAVAAVAGVLPGVAFVGGWMAYGQARVGDPLIFLTAKEAWGELTLRDLLQHPDFRSVWFHVIVAAVVVLLALPSLRRLPVWWTWCGYLFLMPSLMLGIMGLARYVVLALPFPIAAALTLERVPRSVRMVMVTTGGCFLAYFAFFVVHQPGWVP